MIILCTVDITTREVTIPSDQRIASYDHKVDVIRFQVETIPGFSLDTSSIRIAAQGPNKARHDYPVDPSTVAIEEETGYITFDWPIPAGVTEMPIGSGFKYGDRGQLIFAVCAEIISGDTVSKAWHSDDGIITVVAHLEPEAGGGEDPEEEATNAQKIAQLQTNVAVMGTQIGALANGSPTPVETVAEMTDESAVYLYTGSETGYTAGNWYYYDGSAWTQGGQYGGAVTDTTLSISGAAADAKAVGDALSNITIEVDDTLTEQGKAADAKAVGDELVKKITLPQNANEEYTIGSPGEVLKVNSEGTGLEWGVGGSGSAGWTAAQSDLFRAIFENLASLTTRTSMAVEEFIEAMEDESSVVYHSVRYSLSNCYTSNTRTSAADGRPYSATISASTGYILSSVTVTHNGNPVTVSNGSFTIQSVSGPVVVTASAVVDPSIVTYAVTQNLDHVTSNYNDTRILANDALDIALTTATGYEIAGMTVTMGGTDITATAYNNGRVYIASVTGDVVITASSIAFDGTIEMSGIFYELTGKRRVIHANPIYETNEVIHFGYCSARPLHRNMRLKVKITNNSQQSWTTNVSPNSIPGVILFSETPITADEINFGVANMDSGVNCTGLAAGESVEQTTYEIPAGYYIYVLSTKTFFFDPCKNFGCEVTEVV